MKTEIEELSDIYEESVLEEGLLRRVGNKIVGSLSRSSLKDTNKKHEFAKSVAYDVGKDISKVFGGDLNTHTQNIYSMILNYTKTL
jgi:hypothetical protein